MSLLQRSGAFYSYIYTYIYLCLLIVISIYIDIFFRGGGIVNLARIIKFFAI